MLIPLGILAASGAGVAGSYELIETITVGAGGAASVTFSNLNTYSSTYQHLQIRAVARTTRSTNNDAYKITLNGTVPQVWHVMGNYYGLSGVLSEGSTSEANVILPGGLPAANSTANVFGAAIMDFLDAFSTIKNKTIRVFGGKSESANPAIAISSTFLNSTSALSSIKLENRNEPSNFVIGSRFSLYGIKG